MQIIEFLMQISRNGSTCCRKLSMSISENAFGAKRPNSMGGLGATTGPNDHGEWVIWKALPSS